MGLESCIAQNKTLYIGSTNSKCYEKVLQSINGQLEIKSNIWTWKSSKGLIFTSMENWTLNFIRKKKINFSTNPIKVVIQTIQSTTTLLGNFKDMKCKRNSLFNKLKYCDRSKLLSSKPIWNISDLQKTPEHSVEEQLVSILDHQPE